MDTVISSGSLSESHTKSQDIKELQNAPKCLIAADGCFSTNKKFLFTRNRNRSRTMRVDNNNLKTYYSCLP